MLATRSRSPYILLFTTEKLRQERACFYNLTAVVYQSAFFFEILKTERNHVKRPVLQRLENAIKLHKDDQGRAVINPASLALLRGSSNKRSNVLSPGKIRTVRYTRSRVSKHGKGRVFFKHQSCYCRAKLARRQHN